MISSESEHSSEKFSRLINRVTDCGQNLLNGGDSATNLDALTFTNTELAQIRREVGHTFAKFYDLTLIVNDCQALIAYENINPNRRARKLHIVVNNLRRVIGISHYDAEIESLSPLECLQSLESLNFAGTKFTDCSTFSQLPKLKSLTIHANWTLDMSTFPEIPSLEFFDGRATEIYSLLWVSGCPNIKLLDIQGNYVESIEGLKESRMLETLTLSHNPIKSISPIEGHSKIQKLHIAHTNVTDLTPVTTLPSLRVLKVSQDMTSLPSFAACSQYLESMGCHVEVTAPN